jgi:uncharacterized protein (DUF433 family)
MSDDWTNSETEPYAIMRDDSETRLDKDQIRRFVRDVKEGMPDRLLKLKYDLSGRVLALHKMVAREFLRKSAASRPKKRIAAEEVVRDIKTGMDDESLKRKYSLTNRQLQRLYRKVIAGGYMTVAELANRLSITESQITEAFAQAALTTDEFDRG